MLRLPQDGGYHLNWASQVSLVHKSREPGVAEFPGPRLWVTLLRHLYPVFCGDICLS